MRGFTLLEVMIVALLLSLMGLMSWRVLESMTRSQGILRARGDALEETQFFSINGSATVKPWPRPISGVTGFLWYWVRIVWLGWFRKAMACIVLPTSSSMAPCAASTVAHTPIAAPGWRIGKPWRKGVPQQDRSPR